MSTEKKKSQIPIRSTYTVKNLLNDLKKLKLTPSTLYTVGTEVIYFEWKQARDDLGEEDEITIHLEELLSFMQTDYEKRLVQGDIHREKDTPNEAINSFLRETPIEFQSYVLNRPGSFVQGVLQAMRTQSEREIERFTRMEHGIRKELEKSPKDSELWNQLRLVLWVLGNYEEASDAYKKAKKLGWDKTKSKTIGI